MIARREIPLPNSHHIRKQSPKSPHKFFDQLALKTLFAKHVRSRQKSQTKTMTGFFKAPSNVRAPKCACLCQQTVVHHASAGSIRSKNMDQWFRSKLNLLSDLADRAWLRGFSLVSFVCQIYPRFLAQQVPRTRRHVRSPINFQKTRGPCPMELWRATKGQTVSKRGLDHLLHLLTQEMFESFRTSTSFYHATAKSLQKATGLWCAKASFVAIGASGVTSSRTVAATTPIGDPFQDATCIVILCQHWQLPTARPPRLFQNVSSRSLQLRLWGHTISKRHSQQSQECVRCGRVCARAWDMFENDTPFCLTFTSSRRKLGVTCGLNPWGCVGPAPPLFTVLCRQAFSIRAWEIENGEAKNQKKWFKSLVAECAGAFSAKTLAAGPFDCISRLCGLLLGLISGECGCQAQDGAARSKRCSTTRVRSTTLFLVDFCVHRHRDHELVVQSAQHEGGFGSKGKVLESNTSRLDGIAFGQMLRSAIRARVNYSLQGSETGGGSVPAVVFRKQLGLMHWRDLWIEQSSLVLVLKSIKCFQLQPHQLQVKTIGRAANFFSAAQHGLCFTNLTLPNEPTTKLASPAGTMHRLDSVAFCSLFRQKVWQQTMTWSASRPQHQSKAILQQNSFSKALVLLKMISCAHLGRLTQLKLQLAGHRRGMMNMPMERSIPIRQFRLENMQRAPRMSGSFVFSKSNLHKAKSTGKACEVQSSDLTFHYLYRIAQRPYDWCFPVWMLCLYKTSPAESLCCFSMQGGFVGHVEAVLPRLPALHVASASFRSLKPQHSSSKTRAIIIYPSQKCRDGSASKWSNSIGSIDSDAHLVICKSCALKWNWLGPNSVSSSKHLGCKALMSCALGRSGVISKTQVPRQATDFSSPFAELLFCSIGPSAFEATLSRQGCSWQVDEPDRTTMHGLLRLKSYRSNFRSKLCIHIVASTVHSKCVSEQILDENLQFHDCNVMMPWNSRNSKTNLVMLPLRDPHPPLPRATLCCLAGLQLSPASQTFLRHGCLAYLVLFANSLCCARVYGIAYIYSSCSHMCAVAI